MDKSKVDKTHAGIMQMSESNKEGDRLAVEMFQIIGLTIERKHLKTSPSRSLEKNS